MLFINIKWSGSSKGCPLRWPKYPFASLTLYCEAHAHERLRSSGDDGRKRVHFQFPAACSIDWCSKSGIISVWEPLPPGSYQGQPIIKERRWAALRKCQQLRNLQLILSVLKNHVSPPSHSPHRPALLCQWEVQVLLTTQNQRQISAISHKNPSAQRDLFNKWYSGSSSCCLARSLGPMVYTMRKTWTGIQSLKLNLRYYGITV